MADDRSNPNQEGDDYNERLKAYISYQNAQERAAQTPEERRSSTYTKNQDYGDKVRVSNTMASLIVMVAIFFDSIQAGITAATNIPLLGFFFLPLAPLVTPFATLLIGFWFLTLKVEYFKGKQAAIKLLSLFATLVIGLVPILNMIPEITAGALVMIAASRIEDTVGDKKQLTRIAKRRVNNRDAIGRRNRRNTDSARKRNEGKKGGDKRIAREEKKGERALKKFDRKVAQENFGMVARAALGTPKRPVDGLTPKQRAAQNAMPGYYTPDEAVEEYEDRDET